MRAIMLIAVLTVAGQAFGNDTFKSADAVSPSRTRRCGARSRGEPHERRHGRLKIPEADPGPYRAFCGAFELVERTHERAHENGGASFRLKREQRQRATRVSPADKTGGAP